MTVAVDVLEDRNPIDLLNVSESWKERFRIIEKAGAVGAFGFSNASQLKAAERFRVSFSFLAFFFGPFYYLFKGMYQKGFVLLGFSFLLSSLVVLAESFLENSLASSLSYIPVGALCASLACHDYYMLKVKQVTIWEVFKPFQRTWIAAVFAISCLLLPIALLTFGNIRTSADLLADVSGVWRDDDGTVVEISLSGAAKRIKIANQTVTVRVEKTEVRDGIIVLKPTTVDQLWTVRQIWEGDAFTLKFTVDGRIDSDLAYVRPLQNPS